MTPEELRARYRIEPGHPSSCYDYIQGIDSVTPNDQRAIRWICAYQGETDYKLALVPEQPRLCFRWAKCPWIWSYEEGTHWNYANEAEFQQQFNGSWGILRTNYANPVDEKTLDLFRSLYCPEAVTGYYDHETNLWLVCEPTLHPLSQESWQRTQGAA